MTSTRTFLVLGHLLFAIFVISCNRGYSKIEENVTTLTIQPLGAVNQSIVDSVDLCLSYYYGFRIIVNDPKELPQSAFINVKSPRYRADSIIRLLRDTKADSIDFVLGITSSDMSTTKRDNYGTPKKPFSKYQDWGIFGLGYRPGSACIVSTFRLSGSGHAKLIERTQKVAMHEVGHNLGLPHCTTYPTCVMQDAVEKMSTIDNAEAKLCANCRSKID